MSQAQIAEPKTKPWRWVVAALVVAAVLVIAGSAWYLTGGSQQRTVADLLASSAKIRPKNETTQVCGEEVACVEAWRTDLGTYLRFKSEGQAEHWATIIGEDGRQWRNLVLDMSDVELTKEQRRHAIELLFSWHDWN